MITLTLTLTHCPHLGRAALRAGLAAVLALALATGCSESQECSAPPGIQPEWLRQLGCASDYEAIWAERDDAVFAHTHTINWLIDREDDDRVYFINSRTWDLHYHFASAYLNAPDKTPVGTHAQFNLINYSSNDRRFLLGKLVYYADQDILAMEMSAGDSAGIDMIAGAYRRLKGALYDGGNLVYRPVSARQEALIPELSGRIPVIRTEDVFSGQTYQPLHPTVGYGTLRFRRLTELAGQPLLPTDIVVLDRVPNDIAMIAGIITGEFQTPLSHVNILAKNRGTPNMALRGAFDDPALRALEGELVRLTVSPQDFALEPALPADAAAYWELLRPDEALVPAFDLSATDLVDITAVGAESANIVGAKAANLGELTRIGSGLIPLPDAGFAIPFADYNNHLRQNGISEQIETLLADTQAGALSPEELQARLFAIRWAIFTAPVDSALMERLAAKIAARWGDSEDLRFRSSTNVEDLEAFSGAGLYTSASAELGNGPDAIAKAVKVVWASAWNYQAFVERDFYRVDHRDVYMGVLVHPAFEDEDANGVAVTINEFHERRPAFYINSQAGDVSVTNPTGLAIPEQILYYTWYQQPEYEVITRSSLLTSGAMGEWPHGTSVLSDAELAELAGHLQAIHDHFHTLTGGGQGFAMDVEFKLAPGRRLIIKQARPLRSRSLPGT